MMRISIEEGYEPSRYGLFMLKGLVFTLFCLLVLRFWYLQVLMGEQNAQRAHANRWREQLIYANRGLILDDKGVILAENRPSYTVALVREDCPDIPSTLGKISQWTGEPMARLQRIYQTSITDRVPVFSPIILAHDVKFEQIARIESQLANWPGITVISQQRRFYTHDKMFAHVLGYVAIANAAELETYEDLARGDLVGKQGLEKELENRLRGTKGKTSLEVDALGRTLVRINENRPKGGEDIRLSIDVDLQKAATLALGEHSGCIVVMEPDTGKLRALVTAPSYDNNIFTGRLDLEDWAQIRDDARHPLQNRVIQSVYPPGSVWKLMMAPMLLHEGIHPDETVTCTGEFKLGNRTFRCWRAGGHGRVNMRRSLVESCDTYYYQMADRVGIDKITEFARASGFGSLTGIDLPNEKPGVVPGREWKMNMLGEPWQRGETINASIGQGYTLVTPLQMAVYMSSLLNGGRLMKPQILDVEEPVVTGFTPSSDKERAFVVDAMRHTVEDARGTARRILRSDAVMGGKTGTAQVVALGDTRRRTEEMLYQHRDHAWITSWGVKGEKTYVVVVMVEHGGGGSSAAGPVARQVYDFLFDDKALTPSARGGGGAYGYSAQQKVTEEAELDAIIEESRRWSYAGKPLAAQERQGLLP